MSVALLYATAGSADEAKAIARTVVGERLAACANVLAGASSFYWWEGALEEASEAVIVLKTKVELIDALTSRIKDLHSYACPCVVALPVAGGNQGFLDWIRAETR